MIWIAIFGLGYFGFQLGRFVGELVVCAMVMLWEYKERLSS